MARNRDPFTLALETLRRRATEGAFHPERPIVIQEEAKALRLSPTPVREALAWLGGEGLVQRAATGGYLGARLDPAGVRHRYAFRLRCLEFALDAAATLPPDRWAPTSRVRPGYAAGPVFERIILRSGDPVLHEAFHRVSLQLAILTPSEIRLLDGLETEADIIADHLSRRDLPRVRETLDAYHARRIELAVPLLLDVEARAGAEHDA